MALRPQTQTTAPAFESEDETNTATAETPTPEAAAPSALRAAATNAVAAPAAGQAQMYVVRDLKNQLRVEFNTLAQVQATQGSFIDKETEAVLGSEITVELLSWQDLWVCSPNDTTASKELVRYSDDGVADRDGLNLAEHLADLKDQGYSRAKISQRVVLVGALTKAEKDQSLVGELIQIDLPPTGKAQFDRYTANVAWKVKAGQMDPEAAKTIKLSASIAKGADNTKYTLVRFGN